MMIILHFRKIPLPGVLPEGSGETPRELSQPSRWAGADGNSKTSPGKAWDWLPAFRETQHVGDEHGSRWCQGAVADDTDDADHCLGRVSS